MATEETDVVIVGMGAAGGMPAAEIGSCFSFAFRNG